MAKVRRKDTAAELQVRSILHRLGLRFRIHRRDLPGKPDIVLPKFRTIVLVHGCFWHQHFECPRSRRPSSNVSYWNLKLDSNMERDKQVEKKLVASGWRVLTVWECELRDTESLNAKLLTEILSD